MPTNVFSAPHNEYPAYKSANDIIASNKGYRLNDRMNSKAFQKYNDLQFLSSEAYMAMLPFLDPLVQCFRFVLLSSSVEKGFFGGADYIMRDKNASVEQLVRTQGFPEDSALAFLYRIGEYSRAYTLKSIIIAFLELIQKYDFLLRTVDGMSEMLNAVQWETFLTEPTTVSLGFIDTVDSKVQGIVGNLLDIIYDTSRDVFILPVNLQCVDFGIIVFNSNYYNSYLYGEDGYYDKMFKISGDPIYQNIVNMLPTIEKVRQIPSILNPSLNTDTDRVLNFDYSIVEFSGKININTTGMKYYDNVTNYENTSFAETNLDIDCWSVSKKQKFISALNGANFQQTLDYLGIVDSIYNRNDIINKYIESLGYEGLNGDEDEAGYFKRFGRQLAQNTMNVGKMMLNDAVSGVANHVNAWKSQISSEIDKIRDFMNPENLANGITTPLERTTGNMMINYKEKLDKLLAPIDKKFLNINFSDNIINSVTKWYNGNDKPANSATSIITRRQPTDIENTKTASNITYDKNIRSSSNNIENPKMMNDVKAGDYVNTENPKYINTLNNNNEIVPNKTSLDVGMKFEITN